MVLGLFSLVLGCSDFGMVLACSGWIAGCSWGYLVLGWFCVVLGLLQLVLDCSRRFCDGPSQSFMVRRWWEQRKREVFWKY